MKATFFLEFPGKTDETRIILAINHTFINYDGTKATKKFKFSTREKIEPKQWNPQKQRVRLSHREAMEINARLEKMQDSLSEAYSIMVRSGEPLTRETLTEKFESILNPGKKNTKVQPMPIVPYFIPFCEQVVKDTISGKRLIEGRGDNTGKQYSPFTIKGYNTTINHLEKYEKYYEKVNKVKNFKLTFAMLDKSFYDNLIQFFYKDNHSLNSVGKHIKNVKVFAKEAIDRNFIVNPGINHKNFKVLSEDTDQIALSTDELEKLQYLQIESKKLDKIRDCFLLACWSGLRYSDLKHLSHDNIMIQPDGYRLKVVTQKTGETVVIPIKPVVVEILTKYGGKPPIPPSNQKFNEYIKEVVQLAGIVDFVNVSKTIAGKKSTIRTEKFNLATVHTSRRSFATNAYLEGVDTMTIRKMTGHKTEKAFLKYIRVTPEENANRAAKHDFFK